MSKMLKDTELLEIVTEAVKGDLIEYQDTYLKFLGSLAELVGDYCGAEAAGTERLPTGGYVAYFENNGCSPEDGGAFAKYDKNCPL